ncbi:MAG: GIY-YIG nuclease family protein [Candidatus Omnitrophica bacterium]|nr:GIY-YIG nuclease family protein [Candidatus Omnitrophota bacterium]
MYIVYILLSLKEPSKYYIGVTQDLEKRFKEHNNAKSGYANRHIPWQIETFITFKNKQLAQRFEKYLKQGSGNAFLKKRLI